MTDELIEVMARAIAGEGRKLSREALLQLGDRLEEDQQSLAAPYLAQAALQALRDAGYNVAKPFWPPEEIEGASRSGGETSAATRVPARAARTQKAPPKRGQSLVGIS